MERTGASDIEGKATRVGASERGSERVSEQEHDSLQQGSQNGSEHISACFVISVVKSVSYFAGEIK